MRYHYFPVPVDVASKLLESGHKRVIIRVASVEVKRALQSVRKQPCVVVGRTVLRDFGASAGDMLEVEIWSDPESDVIDLGPEFEEALRQDEEAADRFYAMTPGQQRSLAHYVTSAKRSDTRVKRAVELARKLRTRTLSYDRRE